MDKDGNVRKVEEVASNKGIRKGKGEDKRKRDSRVERASRGREIQDVCVSVTTNDLFDQKHTGTVQKKTLSNNALQHRKGIFKKGDLVE